MVLERCYLVEDEVNASISPNESSNWNPHVAWYEGGYDLLTEILMLHGMKMALGYRMVERSGDFVVGKETLIEKVQEVRDTTNNWELDVLE